MSYDLFFKTKDCLTRDDFASYFGGRDRYELTENQAWYRNEDTGVYLSFEWDDDPDPELAKQGEELVAFNLNYFRPHIFGLEAEPEVAAFVAHFNLDILDIFDPQVEGMGEGPYSGDGFLRGWNAGNRAAVRVWAHHLSADTPLTLPEAELTRTWRWNFGREELQERLGFNVFVPKIMFIRQDGVVKSLTTWADGIPLALPRVDMIVLAREELAPRHLFFFRRTGLALVPWDEAGGALEAFRHQDGDPEYWLLDYTGETPKGVASWFVSAGAGADSLMGNAIPVDQIMPAELLAEAAGAASSRNTPE